MNLEKDKTVREVSVQIVDFGFDAERVHPVAEGLLFAALLNHQKLFVAWQVQGWVFVEQVGHKPWSMFL